jgi:hypothetical protein
VRGRGRIRSSENKLKMRGAATLNSGGKVFKISSLLDQNFHNFKAVGAIINCRLSEVEESLLFTVFASTGCGKD